MSKLSGLTYPIIQLSNDMRDEMYGLYSKHYDATDKTLFLSDLADKDYVVVIKSEDGDIKGFSTLEHQHVDFEEKPIRVIFSGDTIIDKDHWGTPILPIHWCSLTGQLKAQYPNDPLYWLLICKGYRTYRYLPLFTYDFFPHYKQKASHYTNRLVDFLAKERFGSAWVAEKGLLQFKVQRGHLTNEMLQVKKSLMDNPHIKFFFEKNPGHIYGDELVCITELTPSNMRGIAKNKFLEAYNLNVKGCHETMA